MRVRARGVREAILEAVEILLLLVAVAALTTFTLLKYDEIQGQAELEAQFERQRSHVEEPAPPAPQALPRELPGETGHATVEPHSAAREANSAPAPLDVALGRLRSPRIGLDVMIAEGVDAATLRRAAGHIPGTAGLDAVGNIGLAAHRDTFFRPLREIRKGDELELETLAGRYRYRVDWMKVVEPDNVAPLAPTSDASLTLVTCFPFHYVGAAPRRFIVRATRVGDPNVAAAAPRYSRKHEERPSPRTPARLRLPRLGGNEAVALP